MHKSLTVISSLTFGIAVGLGAGHGSASAVTDTDARGDTDDVTGVDLSEHAAPSVDLVVTGPVDPVLGKVEYTWKVEEGVK